MSNPEQNLTEQHDALIQKLTNPNNQPTVPPLSLKAKTELKQQLLDQYDTSQPHPLMRWNLWRFAGGVAAIVLLAAVVVNFWLAISQNGATVSGGGGEGQTAVSATDPTLPSDDAPQPTATPFALVSQTLPHVLLDQPVTYEDSITLLDISASDPTVAADQPLQVQLRWEITGRPTTDYTVFVHLVDADGQLVAQADEPLGLTSTFVRGVRPETLATLLLPTNLPPSAFQLVVGLYDSTTGQRLAQSSGEQELLVHELVSEKYEITMYRAVVTGTDGNGLTLRETPQGQALGIIEDGAILTLIEEPQQRVNGLLWQKVVTVEGLTGWVASDFLAYPASFPLDNAQDVISENAVWIIAATQAERSSAADPITLDVTLGVRLETAVTSTLKLHYAHPDWQAQTGGRAPIDGIAEQVVDQETTVVSFTAVLNPSEMETIVGTDQPVLVAQLGNVVNDPIAGPRLTVLAMETFTEAQLDLNATNQHHLVEEPPVQLVRLTQNERLTSMVTFEFEFAYNEEELLNYTTQLFLVHPNNEHMQFSESIMPRTVLIDTNIYQYSATPEQLREMTGSDNPIFAMELRPFSPDGTARIITFPTCPLDLTRTDAFTCKP